MKTKLFTALLLFFCSINIYAKVTSEPLVYGQEIQFDSDVLGETESIRIFLPASFDQVSDDYRYPVLFMNGSHGDQFFQTLTGVVQHLSKKDRIPEFIVVTIDGRVPEFITNGMWSREKIGPWGDPEKYVKHLKQELFPYLKKHYRANDHRLMIGVSGSTLFPMYSLINQPGLFDHYMLVAAADTVGMGLDTENTIADSLAETLHRSPQTKGSLYLVNSDDDIVNARNDYRPNFERMLQLNGNHPHFQLTTEVIPNERHYDVFIKGLLNWFEQLYPEQRWAPKYRELASQPGNALQNIENFYAELSKELGYQVLPKANRWNSVNCLRNLVRFLTENNRLPEALEVAQRRVKYQPLHVGAREQLADTYHKNNQAKQATATLEQAIKLAETQGDDYSQELKAKLAQLKSKVALPQ